MTPSFYVRDLPIYGNIMLAPMAGFSDVPYRALCRAYGSSMHYTEFVPIDALLGKRNPIWNRLNKKEGESPMVFQIFGNDAQLFLRAAQRIEELGPDIIDINMGCSTRKVSGRGAGAGMLRQPALIAETFNLLSKHISVPVTGKIRLGWNDEQRNFVEIGRILEDNGASLVAMHARTKQQKYNYDADWDAIAELKQAVNIPVLGNGDVRTPADVDRMLAHTGCDGVMVGRGAIGNPWIFGRQDRSDLQFSDIAAAMRIHLGEMLAYYGDPHGLVLFRKHVKRYFLGIAAKKIISAMVQTKDSAEFLRLLAAAETAVPAHNTVRDLICLHEGEWEIFDQ